MRVFSTDLLRLLLCVLAVTLPDGKQGFAGEPGASARSDDRIVLTINNEPVSAGEYKLVMERKIAVVYSLLKRQRNLDDQPGYWSEASGPDGPLAQLKQLTLEELVKMKVYQLLAKEKGLINDTRFSAFLENFERENARRQAAKIAGEVVYGPTRYRLPAYYYICFGDLTYRLTNTLARELEPSISESDIKSFLEKNKASFGDELSPEIRKRILELLSAKAAEMKLRTLCASAHVQVNETVLRTISPRSETEPSVSSN